jgi:hypothetical protein
MVPLIFMLSVTSCVSLAEYCYADCQLVSHYAGWHRAEYYYAECQHAVYHYAECRFTECRFADCRGADSSQTLRLQLTFIITTFKSVYNEVVPLFLGKVSPPIM